MPATSLTAHAILRTLDLIVDGPVRWGQPVRSKSPGIFLVEMPAPEAMAQIEIAAIKAWLDRVPTLRLDGARPEPGALADRIRSWWLPEQPVVYVGRSNKSLGARVGALYATALGDRRPHSGGHWLKVLKNIDGLRIWWAETPAPEEYEDAVVTAIAETVTAAERAALPAGAPLLPFANLESVTGEKRPTGLTGSLLDNDVPASATTAAKPGAPSGKPAASAAAKPSSTGSRSTTTSRSTSTRSTSTAGRSSSTTSRAPAKAAAAAPKPGTAPTHVTASGLEAIKRELDDLINVKRPEVILRVKLARELGDLRENADYQAARNEQSFLEGRIQMLEQMVKTAQVIDADHTGEVILGSTVKVRVDGDEDTLHIVGSTEADPAKGRISNVSPVGRALIGHRAGDKVEIVTPSRTLHYEILDVALLES